MSVKLVKRQEGDAFTIYALQPGRDCPVENFLAEAFAKTPDEVEKLIALIDRTADHGIPKNKTKVNTLGDGLFEFKTSGGLRLIWFYDAGQLIICTHGFVKKRQSTPKKELRSARNAMKAYHTAKKAKKISYDD